MGRSSTHNTAPSNGSDEFLQYGMIDDNEASAGVLSRSMRKYLGSRCADVDIRRWIPAIIPRRMWVGEEKLALYLHL